MQYNFPELYHIDQVLPAIKDKPEFAARERGPLTIVNYDYQDVDTFKGPNAAILRECRGLVFHTGTGYLLNRRFHKFFNVGEKDETQSESLPWDSAVLLMDKLDGSMVSPVFMSPDDNSELRWITKMGVTDVSMQAETFAFRHATAYNTLAWRLLTDYTNSKLGYTPIFEWCSAGNRIVLEYPEDRLILLAVRDTYTGRYLEHNHVTEMARRYGIPAVESIATADILAAANSARSEEDKEGYVIRFTSGHMVKVKTDWYVRLHKTKDALRSDRLIIQTALSDSLDDLLPMLAEQDREKVESTVHDFWSRFNSVVEYIEGDLRTTKQILSRKDFALNHAPGIPNASVYFTAWDGKVSVKEALMREVHKALVSDTAYETKMKKALFPYG